jgi:hypothetical protein
MKFLLTLAAFCVTICLTGCFSLESSNPAHSDDELVVIRNYGWKLFYFIPIVCGNANEESWCPWKFFKNEVTIDKMQQKFADYAARKGKKTNKIVYNSYDTVLWEIPIIDFPLPIPYLLCYDEIQLSGQMK